jgi:hypothetical protein
MLYTRIVFTDKDLFQLIALVRLYIKLLQHISANVPNHHQGIHTRVMLSSEYIATVFKVRVKGTFQNILQYIDTQLSVMCRINNVKYLQLN